ncbi:hypothetical protein BOW53_11520 [Solemya pervernicosa gill symbiont]|uniref:TonB-dependent receptor plug domain-containing protein n=1 Tax=Solemya pervernicosa gill symbiont TaxID=642797 RepID=A0A1T2L2W2_9GAMM|nr:hypothetical protein BOW53_11520 [Solemya pervernicosa gill symbiont]
MTNVWAGFDEEESVTIIVSPSQWDDDDSPPSHVNEYLYADDLGRENIDHTSEIQRAMPGMSLMQGGGFGNVVIRGVGSTLSSASESGVGNYVDGIYLNGGMWSPRSLYDVKSIGLQKGPSSVAQGYGTIGGALSIVSRDPDPYINGFVDLLLGDYGQRRVSGAYNQPLGGDWSVRVAGTAIQRDGYTKNLYLGNEVDNQESYAWRGKLRFWPEDGWDLMLSMETERVDDAHGCGKQPDTDSGVNGGILLGGTVPDNPREVMHDTREYQDTERDIYSFRVKRDFGPVKLHATTGYQRLVVDSNEELHGTEVDFASSIRALRSEALSQELRFSSSDVERFRWLAGLYLHNSEKRLGFDVDLPALASLSQGSGDLNEWSAALFGELAYRVEARSWARFGLSYRYDSREVDQDKLLVSPMGSSLLSNRDSDAWLALLPELSIEHNDLSNNRFYAKAVRGYKAGGFNAASIQSAYEPEYLWAYEMGVSRAATGRRLNGHASIFYYDYEDIQLFTIPAGAPAGTTPLISNAARASV